jgi:uncharacterized OB-fold protein
MSERRVPVPTPETAPYWAAARSGELWIPFCRDCSNYFMPPRGFCPRCHSTRLEWRRSSGRATLHSYVISHRAAPGYEGRVPYVIGLVELEEGPRLVTNIVGAAEPSEFRLDSPLILDFESVGEWALPVFRPDGSEPAGRR